MVKFNVLCRGLSQSEHEFIEAAVTPEQINIIKDADAFPIGNVDLLFVGGGADVDPRRYNGNANLCSNIDLAADAWEIKNINVALDNNVPIFAICRGAQSLWVELGGRLKEEVHPQHKNTFIVNNYHKVSGVWGECPVNSFHHQAGLEMPEKLSNVEITMRSQDGIIEAFTYRNNVTGVQWHPEWMPHALWQSVLVATMDGWVSDVVDVSYSFVDLYKYEMS